DDTLVLRHLPHPVLSLCRIPAHPVRLEHADRVAQVERQTDPPGPGMWVVEHDGLNRLNRDSVLSLQVDEQHVDDPIPPAGLLQGQLERDCAVLATAAADADGVKSVEYGLYALLCRLPHVLV